MTDETITIEAGGVYKLTEAAEYLRCSYGLIYKLARSGKLKTFKMGNQYRVAGQTLIEMTGVGHD